MPTYDYRCRKCGHSYELFQAITAKPVKRCPACGKLAAQRLIGTGAAVIFKGSGFYETDYKRAGAAKPACEGGSGDKSASKSESKPESKGDSGKKPGGEACKNCSKAESCPAAKTEGK